MNAVKDYWEQELSDVPTQFELMVDRKKKVMNWESIATSKLIIMDGKEQLIYDFCNKRNIDISEVFIASYYILLHRISNEKDIVVGVDGEHHLLPMKMTVHNHLPFSQFVVDINNKLNQTRDYEKMYSIDYLNDVNCHSSFNAKKTFSYTSMDWFVQADEHIVAKIHYDESFVDSRAMYKLVRHYEKLLIGLLSNPEASVGKIDILLDEDRLAYELLNHTKADMDHFKTILDMFNHTVKKHPNHVALSADNIQYTYQELDEQINSVAHTLIERNICKGDFVSILMERSVEVVISLMAIMKVGAAYIPLDPEHPEDRNRYIISDSNSKIVITKRVYTHLVQEMFQNKVEDVLYYEDSLHHRTTDMGCNVEPDDLAYIIYTSGSTGKPKGTLIHHRGVMNLCPSIRDTYDLTSDDIVLQFSSFNFDASIYEMFGAFYSGAQLHLINQEERISIESFADIIEKKAITCIPLIPTVFFNQLATHLSVIGLAKFNTVRAVGTGGEALTSEIAKLFIDRFKPDLKVMNLYGPTECTAVTSSFEVKKNTIEGLSIVPIGRPYKNYEMYIVNACNQLCPLYNPGEILIKSIGVAEGYLNQPEKTKEVFIQNPFDSFSKHRFYKTGDIGRLLPDGNIEYISRKDAQVKIRGFRIEIGEIENGLSSYESIQDVAVIVKENMLIAYYTTIDAEPISVTALKNFLRQSVPQYMIPHHFCFLEKMPISPTGKMDRKKLDTYNFHAYLAEKSELVCPVSDTEKKVHAAWKEILKLESISTTDHFFEIGGDSLSIMEILVILKPSFPNIKIGDFYQYDTVQQLSKRLEETKNEGSKVVHQDRDIKSLSPYPKMLRGQAISIKKEYHKSILLTGSTGYLGSHILYDLLKNTNDTIYCLLRDGNRSRLLSIMYAYFQDIKEHELQRIYIVKGDLAQPRLGLNSIEYVNLQQKIDRIIHCGAEVKHHGNRSHFQCVNVESTASLLNLIEPISDAQFFYISTLGVPEDLALSNQYQIYPFDAEVSLENVYTNSKLEAEKKVHEQSEWVSSTIYRMGNLVGNSINGQFQLNVNNNAFYRMLKAMILLGKAPQVDWYVDLTPIDYASKYIVGSIIKGMDQNRLMHVCNPIQITYDQMIDYLVDYGYDIELLDETAYYDWLFNGEGKHKEGLQLAMAQLEGDGAKNSNYMFNHSPSDVICHEPNKEFFHKLIDHAVSIGYFPKGN
ncbi:amino acid adenylation domain-containing protein [Hazenella sp. IB182353]|uniref:non-ribosomal peptide synthetase family protein n=1 Tax=Polycladospora coralii TaxID=2771432 RepID=UPI001745EAE9|nr:non-ribosomal peptide synthetase [Polycladospora coralii]MBS7528907.1 amino acid adenylation domain-containing protein [Polycladospora coralii]